MPGSKDFGFTVAKYREKKNWSQEQLSFETGMSRQMINRIENGALPKVDKISPLCAALDISPNDLFEYEADPFQGLDPELAEAIRMLTAAAGSLIPGDQKELAAALRFQAKHLRQA